MPTPSTDSFPGHRQLLHVYLQILHQSKVQGEPSAVKISPSLCLCLCLSLSLLPSHLFLFSGTFTLKILASLTFLNCILCLVHSARLLGSIWTFSLATTPGTLSSRREQETSYGSPGLLPFYEGHPPAPSDIPSRDTFILIYLDVSLFKAKRVNPVRACLKAEVSRRMF